MLMFQSLLWSQRCQQTTSAHLASRSHHEDLSGCALCQFPMIESNWDQITPSVSPQQSLITSDLAPAQLWHTGIHFLGGLWLLADRLWDILSIRVWASKSNSLEFVFELCSLSLLEFAQLAILHEQCCLCVHAYISWVIVLREQLKMCTKIPKFDAGDL